MPARYPAEFLHAKAGKDVAKTCKESLPAVADLYTVPQMGRYFIHARLDDPIVRSNPRHPPYHVMRFEDVLNAQQQKNLLNAWDNLTNLDIKHRGKNDKNRSSTQAYHFGIWQLYRSGDNLGPTGDSINQKPEVMKALDRFLFHIGDYLAPKLGGFLENYCRTQFLLLKMYVEHSDCNVSWLIALRTYMRVHHLHPNLFASRPGLDFKGVFFTVAVKEGSSEYFHIDFNDYKDGITWVVPLGDWEGGELCLPQLGIKIPICAGQALGVMSGVLAHCSAPITRGKRLILTLFTDKFIVKNSF